VKVLLTGSAGFLGWHTRLRLHAQGGHDVAVVTRENWGDLGRLVTDVDAVVHLAGVNRGTDDEVCDGNVALADDLATTIEAVAGRGDRPTRVVYANSVQSGNGTAYGTGKQLAAQRLESLRDLGCAVVDVRLPNVFGEHGRPRYNSFVATFVDAVASGERPEVSDRPVELLHAQGAAQSLIDALTTDDEVPEPRGTLVTVQEVLSLLHEFRDSYAAGEFPDLSSQFRVQLFNCYRAALFPHHYPVPLTPHTDSRGTFVETVRSRGGEGQSSMSTTAPGVTRGEHYHLEKVERFAVVSGSATISLRRMFTDKVIAFNLNGDDPSAVDMPTGWAHNITNNGDDVLITQFWSNELFRPERPDTFPERVQAQEVRTRC